MLPNLLNNSPVSKQVIALLSKLSLVAPPPIEAAHPEILWLRFWIFKQGLVQG